MANIVPDIVKPDYYISSPEIKGWAPDISSERASERERLLRGSVTPAELALQLFYGTTNFFLPVDDEIEPDKFFDLQHYFLKENIVMRHEASFAIAAALWHERDSVIEFNHAAYGPFSRIFDGHTRYMDLSSTQPVLDELHANIDIYIGAINAGVSTRAQYHDYSRPHLSQQEVIDMNAIGDPSINEALTYLEPQN